MNKQDMPTPLAPGPRYQPRIKVAVIGLYRSGSSALASVLEHLGVWMGAPYYQGYFESATLAAALRQWWNEPELRENAPPEVREQGLLEWLHQQCIPGRDAVGAKHPLLSLSAPDLLRSWGPDTKFLWAHRDLDQSISSLKSKGWMKQPELVQTYLWHQTSEFCNRHPHLPVLYQEMTSDPAGTIQKLVEYLELKTTDEQLRSAAALIRPARQMRVSPPKAASPGAGPAKKQPVAADPARTVTEEGLAVVTLWRGEWHSAQAALLRWMQEEPFPSGTKFVWVMPKASAAEKTLEETWDAFEACERNYQCELIVSPVFDVRTNVQKHSFVASLYNEALKNVRREWVIFIEDDVIPEKGGAQELIDSIQAHPQVAVVAAAYRRRLNSNELCAIDASRNWVAWPAPENKSLHEVLWTGGGFAIYRGEALLGSGDFFASVHQGRMTGGWDVNLCWNLRTRGYKVVVHMGVRAEHRFDEGVVSKKTKPARPASAGAENPLRTYFEQNDGPLIDKWIHYFDIYHRHFARFVAQSPTILQIGINQGGSLEMWKKYFGAGVRVIGIDRNPLCGMFMADEVQIYIGEECDQEFLQKVARDAGPFDVVIDDGDWKMQQQIQALETLLPAIKDRGVFLIEDLHTSYWDEYGGGLQRPGSFIEYAKRLVDELNGWHLRNEGRGVTDFTRTVDSMTFYDSLLVLEKRRRSRPNSRATGRRSY